MSKSFNSFTLSLPRPASTRSHREHAIAMSVVSPAWPPEASILLADARQYFMHGRVLYRIVLMESLCLLRTMYAADHSCKLVADTLCRCYMDGERLKCAGNALAFSRIRHMTSHTDQAYTITSCSPCRAADATPA